MKKLTIATIAVCLNIAAFSSVALGQSSPGDSSSQSPPPGLTVGKEGVLLHNNKPFRGIGVNYFDAFSRHLADPQNTSYRAGFEALAKRKIPFVRLIGCGFWPSEQKLYAQDPQEFFRRFDDVVQAAEESHIGLIPSLFWHTATVPDLVGEPLDQWANPQSKTQEYMRRYVRDIVTRHPNSPAIWGWEFGNEYNLAADLPNAADHRPPIVPQNGTPELRTERDQLTYPIIRAAFTAFAQEVRKYDATRVISSGNSIPRDSAWHNWKEKSWTQDTPEQFADMLCDDNPTPMNLLCVHIYGADPKHLIDRAADIAHRQKKPLFIGEFGADPIPDDREQFLKLLARIEEAQVPLAAVWVFDYNVPNNSYNITETNDHSYQLDAITEANARIRQSLDAETH